MPKRIFISIHLKYKLLLNDYLKLKTEEHFKVIMLSHQILGNCLEEQEIEWIFGSEIEEGHVKLKLVKS